MCDSGYVRCRVRRGVGVARCFESVGDAFIKGEKSRGGVSRGERGVAVDNEDLMEVGEGNFEVVAGSGCAGAIGDGGNESLLMLVEDRW